MKKKEKMDDIKATNLHLKIGYSADVAYKKEIPMLFSTDMVIALKNDLKTETRRDRNLKEINENPDDWMLQGWTPNKTGTIYNFWNLSNDSEHAEKKIKCPYGEIGNVIWCRETFDYVANGENFLYKADFEERGEKYTGKWTPNMHMPKLACRIKLEITDITIERLQDITNESALAEGIGRKLVDDTLMYKDYSSKHDRHAHGTGFKAKDSYKTLWEKINGVGSWVKNPFVWKITFRKI
jgi:hypothetical protein